MARVFFFFLSSFIISLSPSLNLVIPFSFSKHLLYALGLSHTWVVQEWGWDLWVIMLWNRESPSLALFPSGFLPPSPCFLGQKGGGVSTGVLATCVASEPQFEAMKREANKVKLETLWCDLLFQISNSLHAFVPFFSVLGWGMCTCVEFGLE